MRGFGNFGFPPRARAHLITKHSFGALAARGRRRSVAWDLFLGLKGFRKLECHEGLVGLPHGRGLSLTGHDARPMTDHGRRRLGRLLGIGSFWDRRPGEPVTASANDARVAAGTTACIGRAIPKPVPRRPRAHRWQMVAGRGLSKGRLGDLWTFA